MMFSCLRSRLSCSALLSFSLLQAPLTGVAKDLELFGGRWHSPTGTCESNQKLARAGGACIHLQGSVEYAPDSTPEPGSNLSFWAERWTARAPFTFRIEAKVGSAWQEFYSGDKAIKVGRKFLNRISIELPAGTSSLRFSSDAPAGTGILIDELSIARPRPMRILDVQDSTGVIPALIGKPDAPLMQFTIETEGELSPKALTGLGIKVAGSEVADLTLEAEGKRIGRIVDGRFVGRHPLLQGTNRFSVTGRLGEQARLGTQLLTSLESLSIDGRVIGEQFRASNRIGTALRQRGQDDCHTYRIPGLATTNQGTLIAVYDNRYRNGSDLPGDIDVGMSRSTDGGQTWQAMRVIMDMGDAPEWNYDGVGDPAILVDRGTGTIWVAATWSHGPRSWHGSGPGLMPEETGQLMLSRSDDDGLTWSAPINITEQVKDPDWRFVLQGPGNGISLEDGTLVFPAQYRSADGPPHHGKPFSTIIYSRDQGATWKIGSGVKIDTTEAQIAQLGDGSIMINCRDNRGGSRSVYTTPDLGATWQAHPSDREALVEPVCNADLLRVEHKLHGPLLFFSNPNTTRGRSHLTLKLSLDEGLTWPERYQTLYDSRTAAGYSSLTQIDDDHIGVLYEGIGELYFLRFNIGELME